MIKQTKDRLKLVFLYVISIIFSILVFTSCRSKETTVKTNYETTVDLNKENIENLSVSSTSTTSKDLKEDLNQNTVVNSNEDKVAIQIIVDYDTDKPIDPKTGKHPTKRETTNIIGSNTNTSVNQQATNNRQITETDTTKTKAIATKYEKIDLVVNQSEKTEDHTKTGFLWYEKLLMTLGLICIGVICFRLYKFIRK